MELELNTENATQAVRLHFGVKGMTKATINRNPRNGSLVSIEIHGVVTKRGMPYFNNLQCLAMDAEHEQDERSKKLLDLGKTKNYKEIQSIPTNTEYLGINLQC